MSPLEPAETGCPFGRHDYEIAYGSLEKAREVHIQAASARPMVVGEVFTFSRENGFYDVIVAEIIHGHGGSWRARCSVIDLQWI